MHGHTVEVDLTRSRVIVDEDGVRWRRRGGPIDERRLRRLLADPQVRVVHKYLFDLVDVAPERRAAFWDEAQAKVRTSAYAELLGAEFVDEARRRLLVVVERC